MTQVRKQIYVTQGYGRNQIDDAALVFTLHRKNLLTSERCACIYQFAKFKKFLEIRDFGWRSLLITIIWWIADAPLSCNLCIQEKSFGCTVFWEIRAAAKFPYFSNYSARISLFEEIANMIYQNITLLSSDNFSLPYLPSCTNFWISSSVFISNNEYLFWL